jgi:hypothetical protein
MSIEAIPNRIRVIDQMNAQMKRDEERRAAQRAAIEAKRADDELRVTAALRRVCIG